MQLLSSILKFFGIDANRPQPQDEPVFLPESTTIEGILKPILMYYSLSEQAAKKKGQEFPKANPDAIHAIVQELTVSVNFANERGYQYEQVEAVFWSPEFMRRYRRMTLDQKRQFMSECSDVDFQSWIKQGREIGKENTGDSVVFYHLDRLFEVVGVRPN